MCLGIPMTVIEGSDGLTLAKCEGRGDTRDVNCLLVGTVEPGDILLVHVTNAIRVIDENEAALVNDALDALEAVMNNDGAAVDHLFSDLIDREPELPDHLKNTN